MPDQTSLIGKRFGKLVVIAAGEPFITRAGYPVKRMICRCDCGKEKTIKCINLTAGRSTSCGCNRKRLSHGQAARGKKFNRTYRIWRAMIRRCRDPKLHNFHRYGGRGIQVCDRWTDFDNFLTDMGECPSEQHSIERKDTDGNYEPGNCVWLEESKQAQNTSNNSIYTVRGVTGCLAELCRQFNVPYSRTLDRLSKGKEPEEAFFGKRPNAKLDFKKAHQIRVLKSTMKTKDISALFGISIALTEMVIANKKWVAPKSEPPTK
jgi:hypothetical protein